ncbi:DNA-methyltransferase [Fuerstiella marisgermanici]|uniref:site-specific DNA-methyltransferase (adenine-specific) n=1 Tax=Fuerstiella marisgermanici TaxID=1891926 RepID=A0A1P8WNU4_9PLAN|nr:site-specific DNA-methyltransferase [Fuerstiella marisgermanici]APZ95727.1 Modification methylase BamHI [Fuerstiella marisgermanici]
MKNNPLPRLDTDQEARASLLPFCRLSKGDVWIDEQSGHRVGCLDAANADDMKKLVGDSKASLAVHDPPYNLVAFETKSVSEFIDWCRKWVEHSHDHMLDDSSFYVWLGADQKDHFQPLPQFMMMMQALDRFNARSLVTMRNQRGYGTQKNWMAVRQELLYYIKGNPAFTVQYTDIPKILRGYYKEVDGKKTENLERSKSDNIRPGNVWVDIQQVFYRMEENVSGCFAQKPLKSIDRIVTTSSQEGDVVLDFFAHSGATLLSSEMHQRVCYTCDIDPIYCEMTIRRLEHFRATGRTGWQNDHAFVSEIDGDSVDTPPQKVLFT